MKIHENPLTSMDVPCQKPPCLLMGLISRTQRSRPDDPMSASHYDRYQTFNDYSTVIGCLMSLNFNYILTYTIEKNYHCYIYIYIMVFNYSSLNTISKNHTGLHHGLDFEAAPQRSRD